MKNDNNKVYKYKQTQVSKFVHIKEKILAYLSSVF